MKRNYRVTINGSHVKVTASSPQAAALIAVGETLSDVDVALAASTMVVDIQTDVIVMDIEDKSSQKMPLRVHCARKSGAPKLCDYATGKPIRDATTQERDDSVRQAERDGGAGVILVDGRRCYVDG